MPPLLSRLEPEEQAIVEAVAAWVDKEVVGTASRFDHSDEYPAAWIEQMKGMGIFGLLVPPPHGDLGVSMGCFALVAEELARGWMSLAGAMGSHSVVVTLIRRFGTSEQKERWLPRLATGEARAAMALTEPQGGSDLQSISTFAKRTDDGYLVSGSKTWISNAQRAGLIALLAKTDRDVEPAYKGISILLVEHGEGMSVSEPIKKLGYRGIEACELTFDGYVAGPDSLLGGEEGDGFAQMMSGLEVGRIQVAARATGVARAALGAAMTYAQDRETFGKPIWRHQAIGNYLADTATELLAARLLMLHAAACVDGTERADLEAGMAKLFASEVCMRVAEKAMRIHGGYGYSKEFDVERFYRDAPLMVIGEGTNEIQKNVIVRQLMRRGGLR